MARKPLPWLRWYVETVRDPKLRRLPAGQRWVWAAVLTASRESTEPGWLLVAEGLPMTVRDLADLAAVSVTEARKAISAFTAAGMLDSDPAVHGGAWRVINWQRRQYQSDNVTDRTRKHRSKERSNPVPGNDDATPEERTQSTEDRDTDPSPHRLSPHGGTRPEFDGGTIDQAVQLASERYASTQLEQGKGRSADGLARYWLQQNAQGAHARAAQLLDEHDLTVTQLADALLSPGARWLDTYRRRNSDVLDDILHGDPPDQAELERVHEMTAGLHQRLPKRARGAR